VAVVNSPRHHGRLERDEQISREVNIQSRFPSRCTEAAMGGVQILGRSHEVKSASFAQPAADMAEDLLLLARACDHPRPRGASTAPLSVVISG
jgi:hypothetical protein